MSDYVSKKAIRYKFKDKLNDEMIEKWDKYRLYGGSSLKEDYKLKNEMEVDYGVHFGEDYKEELYLDIPIKKTYGTIAGDFGNSRMITDEEANLYLEDFKKIIPTISKEDLRYVFYCYYNGVDAPTCYEVGEWSYE